MWAVRGVVVLPADERLAIAREAHGLESRAGISPQALVGDAKPRVVGDRRAQEGHRLGLFLVGVHLCEGHASVIIDDHEQLVPADPAVGATSAISVDAAAWAVQAAGLLGIDVQQVARRDPVIAAHRLWRPQIPEPGHSGELQHATDPVRDKPCRSGRGRIARMPQASIVS